MSGKNSWEVRDSGVGWHRRHGVGLQGCGFVYIMIWVQRWLRQESTDSLRKQRGQAWWLTCIEGYTRITGETRKLWSRGGVEAVNLAMALVCIVIKLRCSWVRRKSLEIKKAELWHLDVLWAECWDLIWWQNEGKKPRDSGWRMWYSIS